MSSQSNQRREPRPREQTDDRRQERTGPRAAVWISANRRGQETEHDRREQQRECPSPSLRPRPPQRRAAHDGQGKHQRAGARRAGVGEVERRPRRPARQPERVVPVRQELGPLCFQQRVLLEPDTRQVHQPHRQRQGNHGQHPYANDPPPARPPRDQQREDDPTGDEHRRVGEPDSRRRRKRDRPQAPRIRSALAGRQPQQEAREERVTAVLLHLCRVRDEFIR